MSTRYIVMTFTVSKSCENTRESWLACDWRFVRRWSDSSEISKLYFLTVITLLLRPRFFAVYFFIILMFESSLIFIFSFNFYTPSYNFILSLPLPRNATPTLPPPPLPSSHGHLLFYLGALTYSIYSFVFFRKTYIIWSISSKQTECKL